MSEADRIKKIKARTELNKNNLDDSLGAFVGKKAVPPNMGKFDVVYNGCVCRFTDDGLDRH